MPYRAVSRALIIRLNDETGGTRTHIVRRMTEQKCATCPEIATRYYGKTKASHLLAQKDVFECENFHLTSEGGGFVEADDVNKASS
ncbi:hypothetical protein CH305_18580 [Rhodococcus sp. 15-649-2-2]|nr:hypothetical protein CH305_18580 [Rhodococcus sp. 15-649-2-2]